MSIAAYSERPQRRRATRNRRLAGGGIVVGSGFLLGRTVVLVAGGSLRTYTRWAAALLIAESAVDSSAVAAGGRLLATGAQREATAAHRAVSAMIVVHAIRVAIFVLGRTGPWTDFDVRPAHRANHGETWTWPQVWFAGTAAALSLVALVVPQRFRRRRPPAPSSDA